MCLIKSESNGNTEFLLLLEVYICFIKSESNDNNEFLLVFFLKFIYV